MAKIRIKQWNGQGDKPEQGTIEYEKEKATVSGKTIKSVPEKIKQLLDSQIKGKWQK